MEILDIVNEQGEPTGRTIPREEAHRTGILHRTSHVWIWRKVGDQVELLLQKRSADKDSFPGCLDISSAGHIPAGCGFEESALRELEEELGVVVDASVLIPIGLRRFTFRKTFHDRLFWDNQISKVLLLLLDRPAEAFRPQPEEIESVCWMPLEDCFAMVESRCPANCVSLEELELIRAHLHTL